MTFLDPIAAAQKAESDARLPFVFPEEFYTKYREQPDGSQKPEDWVNVKKKGLQNGQVTPMRWKDVVRDQALKQVLEPYYKNWKDGQAAPVNGIPLDMWVADAGLVKVLNSVNVRSVEDFVNIEDHLLTRLNVPGIRDKQKRAKAFLEAKASTSKVSEEVAQVKQENDNLKRELAELRALMEQHAIKKEEPAELPAPVVKRRGRPPKQRIEETT